MWRRVGMRGVARTLGAGAVAMVVGLGGVASTAAAQSWSGALLGSSQVPSNPSTGSGFAALSLVGNALTVNVQFSGLTGGAAQAAHIHCCALPTANGPVAIGFTSFPVGTSGTYAFTYDLTSLSTYTSAFLSASGGTAAGAQAALIAGLNAGQAYVNIHNATYPGGEIRANVTTTPEPASLALVAAGLGVVGTLTARRRRA